MSKLTQVSTGSNYSYKGNIYTVLYFCKIKTPEGWIEGVIYVKKERPIFYTSYVRNMEDFTDKFKLEK